MFSIAQPCPACKGDGVFSEGGLYGEPLTISICTRCNGTRYILGEGQMRTIVILGSGDIELGAKLVEAYGCHGLIAPFVNGQYAYGYLHMTTTDPKKLVLVSGVEFIPVDEALKELL